MATPDFCIVTAVTPAYLDLLRWSAPSWSVKPQFAGRPLLVFHHGFRNPSRDLDFLRQCFPAVCGQPWDMPEAANDRERMISAFILGAAQHVTAEYFVKLDADTYFTDKQDVFAPEDFAYDLVAHRWKFTKPGFWIDKLEAWSKGKDFPPPPEGNSPSRRAPRIISFCCLHRTEFVKKAAQLAGKRLPVPSHDSFLWWLADNCRDFSWVSRDLKARGVRHDGHRWRRIREGVCASEGAWNPYHTEILLSHIQLEITTACNLACPNCDRACGIAPSKERMSLDDVRRFAAECRELKKHWRRIDILGGEPTLHPDLLAILEECRPLADEVRLTSNGTGDFVQRVLATVPAWVRVRNSAEEKHEPNFEAYNLAPCDQGIADAQACSIPWRCGLALTPAGYFLCGAGAAVARVFGKACGAKRLGDINVESLQAQRRTLCPLCGHSRSSAKLTTQQEMSPSWEAAVKAYKERGGASCVNAP